MGLLGKRLPLPTAEPAVPNPSSRKEILESFPQLLDLGGKGGVTEVGLGEGEVVPFVAAVTPLPMALTVVALSPDESMMPFSKSPL